MKLSLTEQYTKLDASHDAVDAAANRHIVALYWWRTVVSFSYPFASEYDAELAIPYDHKHQKVRYETPDGLPYDNPAGNRHHRAETLMGFSDLRFLINRRGRGMFAASDSWNVGVGLTLPTGKTEADPLTRGDNDLRHRHIQFGSGTFDPLIGVGYSRPLGKSLSFDANVGFQTSLYESSKGYRAPPVLDFSLGPRWKAFDRWEVSLHYTGIEQGRAHWHSRKDPNTGYFQQGILLSPSYRLTPSLMVNPTLQRTIAVSTRGEGDTFEMDWTYGVTVTAFF